jgi:putative transcriptional regulator
MSGDHLYFIHRLGDIIPGGLEILPGVKVGGDFNLMVDYINSGYPTDGLVKFFLGYSGWEAEQLCGELDKKVWAVYNGTTPQMLLQGQGDSHWHHMVKLLGEPYRGWSYHPLNPKAN